MLKYDPYICFQNLAEFWVVASRSIQANGLGLSIESVAERIKWIRTTFRVIPETPHVVDIWLDLCKNHRISGKKVHDARLASMAIANGISTIVTHDISGFQRFPQLSIVEPPNNQQ